MPVKRRVRKAREDYPMPWEKRPVSRERWERHRARLLENSWPGCRPAEWWAYESPVSRPCVFDGPRECRVLYEIGELSDEEIAELTPDWRRHYEHSHECYFGYCKGPNQWLEGAAARRAHYKWAGIPRDLIKRWDAERAKRTRTIRKLAKGSMSENSKVARLRVIRRRDGCPARGREGTPAGG